MSAQDNCYYLDRCIAQRSG